jgi:hypothetical protein
MAEVLPSPSRHARAATAIGALLLVALLPAGSASAGPLTERLQPTADSAVAQTAAEGNAVRSTVERTAAPLREQAAATARAVVGAAPVQRVLETVREPVAGAVEATAPTVAASAAAVSDSLPAESAPAAAPGRPAAADDGANRIDRHPSRRSGSQGPAGSPADGLGAVSSSPVVPPMPLAPLDELASAAAASSTAAAGDDSPFDGLPPIAPGDGGGLIAGGAGIALLALGLLIASFALIPRFLTGSLPTPPARWGPAAFRVPIERPG